MLELKRKLHFCGHLHGAEVQMMDAEDLSPKGPQC